MAKNVQIVFPGSQRENFAVFLSPLLQNQLNFRVLHRPRGDQLQKLGLMTIDPGHLRFVEDWDNLGAAIFFNLPSFLSAGDLVKVKLTDGLLEIGVNGDLASELMVSAGRGKPFYLLASSTRGCHNFGLLDTQMMAIEYTTGDHHPSPALEQEQGQRQSGTTPTTTTTTRSIPRYPATQTTPPQSPTAVGDGTETSNNVGPSPPSGDHNHHPRKGRDSNKDQGLCVACLSAPGQMSLNCGHVIYCVDCWAKMQPKQQPSDNGFSLLPKSPSLQCPLCRKQVTKMIGLGDQRHGDVIEKRRCVECGDRLNVDQCALARPCNHLCACLDCAHRLNHRRKEAKPPVQCNVCESTATKFYRVHF